MFKRDYPTDTRMSVVSISPSLSTTFLNASESSTRRVPSRLAPIFFSSPGNQHRRKYEASGVALYEEVFTKSHSLTILKSPKKKSKKHLKSSCPPASFFYQLLTIPTVHSSQPLQDLKWLSEFGIIPGDVIREAKMALAIGDKYEEQRKALTAAKFYRKMYFASEMADSSHDMCLALNRLGVVYYNKGWFKKAKKLHKMHLNLSANDFIPAYNMGIIQRCLKYYSNSEFHFSNAISISISNSDSEGRCIALAQLGLTRQGAGELLTAKSTLQESLLLCGDLVHINLQYEILEALGYLCYHLKQLTESEMYFLDAMRYSKGTEKEVCRCNVGILRTMQFQDKKKEVN